MAFALHVLNLYKRQSVNNARCLLESQSEYCHVSNTDKEVALVDGALNGNNQSIQKQMCTI